MTGAFTSGARREARRRPARPPRHRRSRAGTEGAASRRSRPPRASAGRPSARAAVRAARRRARRAERPEEEAEHVRVGRSGSTRALGRRRSAPRRRGSSRRRHQKRPEQRIAHEVAEPASTPFDSAVSATRFPARTKIAISGTRTRTCPLDDEHCRRARRCDEDAGEHRADDLGHWFAPPRTAFTCATSALVLARRLRG